MKVREDEKERSGGSGGEWNLSKLGEE